MGDFFLTHLVKPAVLSVIGEYARGGGLRGQGNGPVFVFSGGFDLEINNAGMVF